MELIELEGLTPEGRAELAAGEAHPFGVNDLRWRESDRYYALREDGRLVAAAGLVVAQVEVGRVFDVVGVGGVIVARPRRGAGLMRRVLDAALERAEQLGPSYAMLFCSHPNARRYARFGFHTIEATVTAEQPGRTVEMGGVAMWRPLRDGAGWPDGRVRVLGLPF
jgi:predicted GNAT family N-acyltransferase